MILKMVKLMFNKMKLHRYFSIATVVIMSIIFIPLITVQTSCTKDITIFVPSQIHIMVVEGHIETGFPPYVLLTKSTDFYSTLYLDSLDNFYVHGAIIKVFDG